MDQKHKILLIEPPFYRLYNMDFSLTKFSLSLGYISSAIKMSSDWQVLVYNADFTSPSIDYTFSYLASEGYNNYINHLYDLTYHVWEEVRSNIIKHQPNVVGISSKSQNFASACNVAKICKQINKDIIIIMGGPHTSLAGCDVMECQDIDIAVKGEGEEVIIEILRAIEDERDLHNINGIIFRKNGEIVENSPRALISDLNLITSPYKYVNDILLSFDKYPLHAFRSIFAIRGCPYNCFFCGSGKIWQKKVRFRSVTNVVEEIRELQGMGVNYFNFDDDTFGVTSKYLQELCVALKTHCSGIKWSCEMHVKLINDKNVAFMRQAGCDLIKIGIESGNNEILSQIGKEITIQEAMNSCKIIKKHNINLMAFYMVGFPQDTEDTIKDTMNAIKNTPGYVTYSIFTPYIGTEAFRICQENELIPEDFDVALYNHQSPANNFCKNITHNRFREIASSIEGLVDKKNRLYRKKLFIKKFRPHNIVKTILGNFK